MRQEIGRILALVAIVVAAAGAARAQSGPERDFEPLARRLGDQARPAPAPAASLEALNKILSASQLTAVDRSLYLSIRAFQLARLGREADSQKDVSDLARVLPNAWNLVLSSALPDLAGVGDRAAALRVLDYGLKVKPDDPWLRIAQAQVYMQLADFARALGLVDGVASATAGDGAAGRAAVFYRGLANFNLGDFQAAADDFAATLAGDGVLRSRLWVVLWRYAALVHTPQNARAALARDLGPDPGGEDLERWPGPIARFLLGRLGAGELEVAAETDELAKRGNGKCPAAFFAAMEAERRGDRQRAREQLQLAQARCPTASEFNWAASSQLKRL